MTAESAKDIVGFPRTRDYVLPRRPSTKNLIFAGAVHGVHTHTHTCTRVPLCMCVHRSISAAAAALTRLHKKPPCRQVAHYELAGRGNHKLFILLSLLASDSPYNRVCRPPPSWPNLFPNIPVRSPSPATGGAAWPSRRLNNPLTALQSTEPFHQLDGVDLKTNSITVSGIDLVDGTPVCMCSSVHGRASGNICTNRLHFSLAACLKRFIICMHALCGTTRYGSMYRFK